MKRFNYDNIENVIGYHFNNGKLLKQAFFRSSFAHENGRQSNEVLEFIGDKVLDLAVIRILLKKYAKAKNSESYLKSSKQEGELTKMKSGLVSTDYLANAFDNLHLEEFIYYGKSDENNNVKDVKSIKEDVFEAIIGAIAIDSNWDMDIVIKIVKKLLNTDNYLKQSEIDTNYVGLLQEQASSLGLDAPIYDVRLMKQDDSMVWRARVKINGTKYSPVGFGYNQKDARKNAAKAMIQLLKTYQKELELKKVVQWSESDVFSVINSLVQTGEINKPIYEFKESYDNNGNPCWECATIISNLGFIYYGYGSTKKEAQKHSLETVLENIKGEA